MRYHALACAYDGTIAWHGKVDEPTIKALEQVRESGRKLLLVTGREVDDLASVFPRLDLFDRIVAENGALLYRPSTREERALAEAPPKKFSDTLKARGAERVSVGRVIVATWEPHETTALEVIREMGLELQVIFNKGAVMVLPSGINKAVGLVHALAELDLSPHNVVGIGDAENDHAFLTLCECSVAVSNALPTVKDQADWVTEGSHGLGVQELVRALLTSDLAELEDRLHHKLVLGKDASNADFTVHPYGANMLISGTSGGGKSTLATALLENLAELKYQFLVVDPEGDYSTFEQAIVLGDPQRPPSVQEVLDVLTKGDRSAAVNLVGLHLKERPKFFEALLSRIQEMRAKTGRPHWIIVDEAHHVLPASWDAAGVTLSQRVYGTMLVTLEADRVSPAILSTIELVIAVGDKPDEMFRIFANSVGSEPPKSYQGSLERGEALAWFWRSSPAPVWFRSHVPRAELRRHRRKYAEGELPPDQSFYFRGPEGKLNLRAQNLNVFLQMADGIDDDTWNYHLREGDIARWFRETIKDSELAEQIDRLGDDEEVSAEDSRRVIREEIERRYILAA